jgi:hypothetical protein
MKFLDPNDPFFRQRLGALADRASCRWLGDGGVLLADSPFWGVMFLAAGGYAGWQLFFVRDRTRPQSIQEARQAHRLRVRQIDGAKCHRQHKNDGKGDLPDRPGPFALHLAGLAVDQKR